MRERSTGRPTRHPVAMQHSERRAVLGLRRISVKDTKSKDFYQREARRVLKSYHISDPNFKYFIEELVLRASEALDGSTIRSVASELQRAGARATDPPPAKPINCTRLKLKTSKKDFRDIYGINDDDL